MNWYCWKLCVVLCPPEHDVKIFASIAEFEVPENTLEDPSVWCMIC